MKDIELTAEEIKAIEELREKKAAEITEQEKRWAQTQYDKFRYGGKDRYINSKIKEGAMKIKLGKLLKKWDTNHYVRFRFIDKTYDSFKHSFGEEEAEKLALIQKYHPTFTKPKIIEWPTASFHLDFSGNKPLMKYIRKRYGTYHNDGIFKIQIHEQYDRGYFGGVKALKVRGDMPFDSSYSIMSAKAFIEAVNDWARWRVDDINQATVAKKALKVEVRCLIETGAIKKVRWDSDRESGNKYKITFTNDSSIDLSVRCLDPEYNLNWSKAVYNAEPPVTPKSYEDYKELFIKQNYRK